MTFFPSLSFLRPCRATHALSVWLAWGLLLSAQTSLPSQAEPPPSQATTTDLLHTLHTDPSLPKRLQAFRTLESLGAMTPQHLLRCITDTAPEIRAEALRLGLPWTVADPELELKLFALAQDRSGTVRLALLKGLRSVVSPNASALAQKLFLECLDTPALHLPTLDALGDAFLPTLRSLFSSQNLPSETASRRKFLFLAGNHLREHAAEEPFYALFDAIAQEAPLPSWVRLTLLRGALGHTSPECAPPKSLRNPRTLPLKPKALDLLVSRPELGFQRLLEEPHPMLRWPSTP